MKTHSITNMSELKGKKISDIPGYEHSIGFNEEGTMFSFVVRDRIFTRKANDIGHGYYRYYVNFRKNQYFI